MNPDTNLAHNLAQFKQYSPVAQRGFILARTNCLSMYELCMVADNLDVFIEFCDEAHKIAMHRDHYSARTIVEVMRHHSTIRGAGKQFKISNNITPLMAKLSMDMFPMLNGLFSTRRGK